MSDDDFKEMQRQMDKEKAAGIYGDEVDPDYNQDTGDGDRGADDSSQDDDQTPDQDQAPEAEESLSIINSRKITNRFKRGPQK